MVVGETSIYTTVPSFICQRKRLLPLKLASFSADPQTWICLALRSLETVFEKIFSQRFPQMVVTDGDDYTMVGSVEKSTQRKSKQTWCNSSSLASWERNLQPESNRQIQKLVMCLSWKII